MRLAALVNQTTDRAARWIVNAGDTACPDGNELLLRRRISDTRHQGEAGNRYGPQ